MKSAFNVGYVLNSIINTCFFFGDTVYIFSYPDTSNKFQSPLYILLVWLTRKSLKGMAVEEVHLYN